MPFRGCCGPGEGGKTLPGLPLRSGAPRSPHFRLEAQPGLLCLFAPRCCQLKNETAPASPSSRQRARSRCHREAPGQARDAAGIARTAPSKAVTALSLPGCRHREPPGRAKPGILRLLGQPRDPHGTRRRGHSIRTSRRSSRAAKPWDAPMDRGKTLGNVLGIASPSEGTNPASQSVTPACPSEGTKPASWGGIPACPLASQAIIPASPTEGTNPGHHSSTERSRPALR